MTELVRRTSSLKPHRERSVSSISLERLERKDYTEELIRKLEEKSAELRKTTEELRLSRERLNSFFSGATAGICILDSDLRYVQINKTLAAINGFSAKYHIGKSIYEIIPDVAPAVGEKLRQVLATGKPMLDVEISGEVKKQPGKKHHWLVSYFSLRGPDEAIGAIVVDITRRKEAEEKLRRSREQLRALAARLQVVREEEATRIAREIHDILGQSLSSLAIDLNWLKGQFLNRPGKLTDNVLVRFHEMNSLLKLSSLAIQRIAGDLRPPMLDDLGLPATLEWAAHDWEKRTGIPCRWKSPPKPTALNRDQATALFRIFQEALTNVSRHANASKVMCDVRASGNCLILQIKDNGKGFDVRKISDRGSLGLLGIKERALLLGGKVDIKSALDKGTKVTISIPFGE